RSQCHASNHTIAGDRGVVFPWIKRQPKIVGREIVVVIQIVIARSKRELALRAWPQLSDNRSTYQNSA
ncbi:MAG: hypothetical protein WCQ44_00800, partial [Opitutaceae bacterium]